LGGLSDIPLGGLSDIPSKRHGVWFVFRSETAVRIATISGQNIWPLAQTHYGFLDPVVP